MALLQSTLASELSQAFDSLTGSSAPTNPSLRIAQAFGEYFKTASSPSPPISSIVDIAVSSMVGAMVFSIGTPSSGAATFVSGFSAFWATIQESAATCWPGFLAGAPPPGLASLASLLVAGFAQNNIQGITNSQAANNLASVIHPNAGLGGIVNAPGPVPTPIL